jgi:hypothetical protein
MFQFGFSIKISNSQIFVYVQRFSVQGFRVQRFRVAFLKSLLTNPEP